MIDKKLLGEVSGKACLILLRDLYAGYSGILPKNSVPRSSNLLWTRNVNINWDSSGSPVAVITHDGYVIPWISIAMMVECETYDDRAHGPVRV